MDAQISLFEAEFGQYHENNPHIYTAFEGIALKAIEKGFKHYGAKGIFEILRWETATRAEQQPFKVNNNYTPLYARLFEKKHPEYKGFFRNKKSKFDERR